MRDELPGNSELERRAGRCAKEIAGERGEKPAVTVVPDDRLLGAARKWYGVRSAATRERTGCGMACREIVQGSVCENLAKRVGDVGGANELGVADGEARELGRERRRAGHGHQSSTTLKVVTG